ncbi:hypothetical protein FQR65_LT01185 [Abscondita terminalis]|nr:hypothetical protein FQR65_LT01185 [Abscondita terminalis]
MGIYKIHVARCTTIQETKNYGFHYLVKNSILLGQCFALLPVDGVTLTESKLQFKWLSFRTAYTIITGLLLLLYTICVFIYTLVNSENFFAFVVVIWNLRAFLGITLFFRISRRWPALVKHWVEVETSMTDYEPLIYIKLKYRILAALYFITGIVEHGLFVAGGIKRLSSNVQPSDNYFQKYFELQYAEFFHTFKYAHWKAVIVEFLSLITTYQWQFTNYFIAIIAIALAERFQQISKKINSKQLQNEDHWRNVRQHYNSLTLLCKSVNDVIGLLVVLAFLGNLYFLSISALQCLSPRNGFEMAYYWYGFLFT